MIHTHWQSILEQAPPGSGTGAGLASLAELAAVRFRGRDARKFLQGYLTCDTDLLEPGSLLPTALCNLKGRVVMNGWCSPDASADPAHDVLLVLHTSLVERLIEFLDKYLRFSRTTLDDLREHRVVLGSLDETAESGLVLDARRRLFVLDDVDQARALWDSHPRLPASAWMAALTADLSIGSYRWLDRA
jgi:folate-binding Fe-S cluster repair protein YgfZ